jgi:hypothetical protein
VEGEFRGVIQYTDKPQEPQCGAKTPVDPASAVENSHNYKAWAVIGDRQLTYDNWKSIEKKNGLLELNLLPYDQNMNTPS